MNTCCTQNAPINGCNQGRDCPVNAAKCARTCEALGICQHPERECPGACEQTPRLPELTTDEQIDRIVCRFTTACMVLITAIVTAAWMWLR